METSTGDVEASRFGAATTPSGCIVGQDLSVSHAFGPRGTQLADLLCDERFEGECRSLLTGLIDQVFESGVDLIARPADLRLAGFGRASLTIQLADQRGGEPKASGAERLATVTIIDTSSVGSFDRARIRAILGLVPMMVFAVDEFDRLLFTNERAAEIFGTIPGGPTSTPADELFVKGDLRLDLLLTGNDDARQEGYSLTDLDAGSIGLGLVRVHKTTIIIDDTRCVLAVCVSPDQRRRGRLRLELREAQLSRLIDLLPAPVWVIDRQRRITRLNTAARSLTHFATSFVIGANVHAAYPSLASSVFGSPDAGFESLATTDRPAAIFSSDEHDRVFRVDRTLLPGDSGPAAAMAVMLTDLSEVLGAQQELHLKNEVLEHRNAELDQFAHMASHDLRAPLRAIYAFTQMAIEDEGDEHRDHLGAILSSVDRMRSVLDSLLDFATANTNPVIGEVALSEVVESVLGDLASDIAESGAKVNIGELPVLQCDETSMRRLFQNLISNAITYAGDEPPSITITSTPEYRFVEIVVTDRGIGFPQHQEQEVFRPFKRLSADSAGQGIGLSMCRRIVESHHGTIRAISQIGGPTSMVIRLPRRRLERSQQVRP